MSGWDGNGNFVMPYSMVQQAGANVKILSTVQDAQWAAVAGGLMNCMTLDSQTKPKADVDIATHKLINVSAPAAATDAANKSYVDSAVAGINFTEWLAESHGVAWVSTTSFSVAGVNATAIYHAGRRVKITHNTGGTVSYGTVVSSSFSVNTTVVVAVDGGVALISTVTAVSYGLLGYTNPSYLDPRTAFYGVAGSQTLTGGAAAAQVIFSPVFDALSEYSGVTNHLVVQHPGVYVFSSVLMFQNTSATTGQFEIIGTVKKNASGSLQQVVNYGNSFGTGSIVACTLHALDVAVVGDYYWISAFTQLTANVSTSTFGCVRIA